jgi:hypothetical protein
MKTVYILILNWNGWGDTLECLESVFRHRGCRYRVILCDNGSEDRSVEKVKAWAEGLLDVRVPPGTPLRHLSFPPVTKPVPWVEFTRAEAEKGGKGDVSDTPLVLIQTGANLGFAGGNNVGLRYALAQEDCAGVWLLNNDTVVEPDALVPLLERLAHDSRIGMCGSLLPYYDRPEVVWAMGGGRYNRWFAWSRNIGLGRPVHEGADRVRVESQMDYLAGASMFVTPDFLREVGLMCEDYFLYFEEPDWSFRGWKLFVLAYAPQSIVYHKVGASTTSGVTMYYMLKNQIRFTIKFFPACLPTVFARAVLEFFRFALKRVLSSSA